MSFDDNQIYCYFRAVRCRVSGFLEVPLTDKFGETSGTASLNTTEGAEFAVNMFKPFKFGTRSEIIVMHILNDCNTIL